MRYFEIQLPGYKPEHEHLMVWACALSSNLYYEGCVVTEIRQPTEVHKTNLNFNLSVKHGSLVFEHYLMNANNLHRSQDYRRLAWMEPPGDRQLPREERLE